MSIYVEVIQLLQLLSYPSILKEADRKTYANLWGSMKIRLSAYNWNPGQGAGCYPNHF